MNRPTKPGVACSNHASRANTEESWLPVPGYAGKYEVSDLGRVRSLLRHAPRILRYERTYEGYLRVELYLDGAWKKLRVHGLVLLAFRGQRLAGATVDHLDGDKENNRLSNLEYVSRKENIRRAWSARRASES